jgi:hypothetical protein
MDMEKAHTNSTRTARLWLSCVTAAAATIAATPAHAQDAAPAVPPAAGEATIALPVQSAPAPAVAAQPPAEAAPVDAAPAPEAAPPADASAPDVAPVIAGAPAAPPAADRYYSYNPAKAAAPSRPHHTFGMTMDVGLPDGAALGVVVRPKFDWLRLGAAVTHNGMGPGLRFGVTLDPVSYAVGPTLTVEGGHCFAGTVPGIQGSPSIGYDYANFHLGLEFGNRSTFRFFVRGGASWVNMSSAQAQNSVINNGSTIMNPSYTGWVAPSAKLGFALYF